MALNEHGRESMELLKRDPVVALNAYNPPNGWNMPLHKNIIARIQNEFSGPSEAASDESFLRDVHTLLRAWYGKREWLIIDYDVFRTQVCDAAELLDLISVFRIEDLEDDCKECYIYRLSHISNSPPPNWCCVNCMTEFLWKIIHALNVTKKNAKIVSGTKTLHHFLPNLLPPMDNRYTGEFFLGYGIGEGGKSVFRNLYSGFVDLARCLTQNEKFMSHVGVRFNTSLTKTLDNAKQGEELVIDSVPEDDHDLLTYFVEQNLVPGRKVDVKEAARTRGVITLDGDGDDLVFSYDVAAKIRVYPR